MPKPDQVIIPYFKNNAIMVINLMEKSQQMVGYNFLEKSKVDPKFFVFSEYKMVCIAEKAERFIGLEES